jgi:hypothetical protein
MMELLQVQPMAERPRWRERVADAIEYRREESGEEYG